jgi:hypothetical protein
MHIAEDKSKFLRDLTKSIHKCVIEARTMEKPVIAAVMVLLLGQVFHLL